MLKSSRDQAISNLPTSSPPFATSTHYPPSKLATHVPPIFTPLPRNAQVFRAHLTKGEFVHTLSDAFLGKGIAQRYVSLLHHPRSRALSSTPCSSCRTLHLQASTTFPPDHPRPPHPLQLLLALAASSLPSAHPRQPHTPHRPATVQPHPRTSMQAHRHTPLGPRPPAG